MTQANILIVSTEKIIHKPQNFTLKCTLEKLKALSTREDYSNSQERKNENKINQNTKPIK